MIPKAPEKNKKKLFEKNLNQNTKDLSLLSEFQILFNLKKFLFKLFMNVPFNKDDLSLTNLEKEIIKIFVKKKKFIGFKNLKFSIDFFDKARTSNLRKKKEDGLKYIFKKAIRHLKDEFKSRELPSGSKVTGDDLDRLFYEHHFGGISKHYKIPLESFYHFRNWRTRFSEHIPKSVTRDYVTRLHLNPVFIGKICNFLQNKLLKAVRAINFRKIKTMVLKFERLIENHGPDEGLTQIQNQVFSRGNKLLWTSSEVTWALQDALDLIDSCN